MKTRTLHRILEGTFLFSIIVLIYALSIFSAKGQMSVDYAHSYGNLGYLDEGDFRREKIFFKSTFTLPQIKPRSEKPSLKEWSNEDRLNQPQLKLQHNTIRKRRRSKFNPLQAPNVIIPF